MLSLYTNLAIRLKRNEKGATAVEYGIMVGLIAVVIIVAVTLLGDTVADMFGAIACEKLKSPAGVWSKTANTCTG